MTSPPSATARPTSSTVRSITVTVRRWAVAAPYRLDWRALSMTIPSANLYRTTRPDLQEGCKRCPAPADDDRRTLAAQPARQLVLNGPRGWESRCLRSARPSTAISLAAPAAH